MKHIKDIGEYKICELSNEEIDVFWEPLVKAMFDENSFMYDWRSLLKEYEKEKLSELRDRLNGRVWLNLVIYHGEKVIGWTRGRQESAPQFYIMSSAILPEYRRQGLYTELMTISSEILASLGFQTIRSDHALTNNSVIIAKLKYGFKITGMECSDYLGMLLNMTYYVTPKRNEILDFRVGHIRPTEEIKSLFKI